MIRANAKVPTIRRTQGSQALNLDSYSDKRVGELSFKAGHQIHQRDSGAICQDSTNARVGNGALLGGILDQLIEAEQERLEDYQRELEKVRKRLLQLKALKRLSSQAEQE